MAQLREDAQPLNPSKARFSSVYVSQRKPNHHAMEAKAHTENGKKNSKEQPKASRHKFGLAESFRRAVTFRADELVFALVVLVLASVSGFAAYSNILRAGWGSDAAAWAQAGGSIIAVAGAAWISRNETRRARRWRREQGEEAAWGVRFVIAQAQFDAQIVAAELTNHPFGTSEVLSWRQRSANASLALQTMLTRADHIHPAVVLSACNAKILVDQLSRDLEALEACAEHDKTASDDLISSVVSAHRNLISLIDQFDARISVIRDALDRGYDMLPLHELYK